MSTSTAFLCGPRIYTFEGWTFEDVGMMAGPWPLKQNGDPRAKAGRQFYLMWGRFDKLSKAEKEKHRVGGGCERFEFPGANNAVRVGGTPYLPQAGSTGGAS
jgi:hypothetical protein